MGGPRVQVGGLGYPFGLLQQPTQFSPLQVNTTVVVTGDRTSRPAAVVEVDQTQINRLFLNLVRIGEKHGIKFPREFGESINSPK